MCEARVILQDARGNEVEAFEDITTIVPEAGALKLFDLYGGHTTVAAELKEVRLLDHTVVLETSGS